MEITPKQLLEYGKKNKLFLDEIKKADNDKMPNILDNNFKNMLFAVTYYGWLVGNYGSEKWKLYVNPKNMICPNCEDEYNRLRALHFTHQCDKCGYVRR